MKQKRFYTEARKIYTTAKTHGDIIEAIRTGLVAREALKAARKELRWLDKNAVIRYDCEIIEVDPDVLRMVNDALKKAG